MGYKCALNAGGQLLTKRVVPSLALALLIFEVLLKALGEHHGVALGVTTVLGLAGGLYFNALWKKGAMSSTALVIWSAAVPFCLALVFLFIRSSTLFA